MGSPCPMMENQMDMEDEMRRGLYAVQWFGYKKSVFCYVFG